MAWDDACVHYPAARAAAAGREGAPPAPPIRLRVLAMEMNDELGAVTHALLDKTGTLTENDMRFRKFCVGGVSYGLGSTSIGNKRRRREVERKGVARFDPAIAATVRTRGGAAW